MPNCMKTALNILFLILILFSCRKNEKKIDIYSLKEDSVLYELADSIITPDSAWRKFQVISLPVYNECSEKVKKRKIDSLLQLFDTVKLFISIDNKLILFSKLDHSENLIKNIDDYFRYSLKNVDTSYFALFQRFVSDTILLEKRMDIEGIHSKYNYTIIPSDSAESFRNKGSRIVENYKISRIIFNEKYDKACFYYQITCGHLCAVGYLMFIEKRNGIWNIVKKHQLWIS